MMTLRYVYLLNSFQFVTGAVLVFEVIVYCRLTLALNERACCAGVQIVVSEKLKRSSFRLRDGGGCAYTRMI